MSNLCWVADAAEVFCVASIISSSDDEYTIQRHKTPKPKEEKVKQSATHPIDSLDELQDPPSDLIQLTDVHRPGILHTLRTRFEQDIIYTSVGPILVALNPFRWLPGIYDEDVKQKYENEVYNLSANPHVFAMAHDALVGLQFGRNQSLIISGESGAGKTETTKKCLDYIASVAGSSNGVQDRILQANPILEAWGNAKTLRNNNSSRFGKFIEIRLSDSRNEIVGSSNTTYLLEKSRVVFQEAGERNYHIFYQVLFGAPQEDIEALVLHTMRTVPETIHYLNQSGCLQIDGSSDADDYAELVAAYHTMGFSDAETAALQRAIAGILHLGNINFVPNPQDSEGSIIDQVSEPHLAHAAALLGFDPTTLPRSLLFKSVRSGRRASVIFAPHLPETAAENRDALTKAIYSRCFDYLVRRINESINTVSTQTSCGSPAPGTMIGVLDIFGFEIFQKVFNFMIYMRDF